MADKPSDPAKSRLKMLVQSHFFCALFSQAGSRFSIEATSLESSGSEIGFSPSPL